MLFDLYTDKMLTKVPFPNDYKRWASRLTKVEMDAIKEAINAKIEGHDFSTSSWMPGKYDWTGTVFQPMYEKATRHNPVAAAKFLGLIVWTVFMERPERWRSDHFDLNGVAGRTYFLSAAERT